MNSINDVIQESKGVLSDAVENLVSEIELQSNDSAEEEVKLNAVKNAVSAFEAELSQWKKKFDDAAPDELKLKAGEQVFRLCNSYIQQAGFKSKAGKGMCFPSIEKLDENMKDFRKMIQAGKVDWEEIVFLKTFFIPTEKYPVHSVHDDIQKYVSRVHKELHCLKDMLDKKFSHENVAKIHDVLIEAAVLDQHRTHVGTTVCIVQELVDGGIDLFEWVHDWRRDTHAAFNTCAALDHPGVARYFFRSLMEAVSAMHERRIYHYDIKIENIMVSRASKALKLVDFGLAKVLGAPEGGGGRVHSIDAPAVHYLAPEVRGVREGGETIPESADVWCCGVVLLALAVRPRLDVALSFDALLAAEAAAGRTALRERLEGGHEDGAALRDLLSRPAPARGGARSPRTLRRDTTARDRVVWRRGDRH